MLRRGTIHEPVPVLIHAEDCELEGWDDPVRGRVNWRTLLSVDRTPSDSLTCGVAEIPPADSETFNTHQHAQAEVYYFLAGEGIVMVDGIEHRVKEGSTLFIPSNAEHGVRNTGTELLRLFYVFAVDSFEDVTYIFPQAVA